MVRDTDGPRIRLGVLWFAVAVAAAVTGRVALGGLMAVAAALAAHQLAVVVLDAPHMRLPAALGAGALPLAASAGSDTLTAAVAATVVVTMVWRVFEPAQAGATVEVGLTVAFSLSMGLAAATPVLVGGLGRGPAVAVLLLVSAHDAGDFIVGTGSARRWEGPAAGIVTVLVLTFATSVVAPSPLTPEAWWVVGGVVAALAPLGPPAASVLLGSGRRRAGYVRRLDSYLLAGPVAAYAVAILAA